MIKVLGKVVQARDAYWKGSELDLWGKVM